jgi:hypothetical protein
LSMNASAARKSRLIGRTTHFIGPMADAPSGSAGAEARKPYSNRGWHD